MTSHRPARAAASAGQPLCSLLQSDEQRHLDNVIIGPINLAGLLFMPSVTNA